MTGSTRERVAAVPQVGRVDRAEVLDGLGLHGDHRATGRNPDPRSKRHVSLIQAEHLPVIAALEGTGPALGPGGFQALRGDGGITARVVTAVQYVGMLGSTWRA